MKFRKKPIEIEALQFQVEDASAAVAFCGGRFVNITGPSSPGARIAIDTLEGTMEALPGDWIIKGVQGEFYPCKPDIFEATYDPSGQSTEPTDAEVDSAIAAAARTIKKKPGSAVEIAGVRIEACDEYGRTSTTRRAERAEAALADVAQVLRRLEEIPRW